jgi:hypothetical protein
MRRVLGIVIVITAFVTPAHAQSGEAGALAQQLFNQGRELANANRWAEACAKFEASLHYEPVLGTRLNLATCDEQIGKLASAWALYRDSIEIAQKAGDVKRRDYAQKRVAALEPRLPRLSISPPAKPPTGLVVTRDGTPIETSALGVALYVDPGVHAITAAAPGFDTFSATVTLVEGKTETLAIPALRPAPAPPPVRTVAGASPPVPREASPGLFTTRRKIAIGVAGASVIGVVAGVVLGASAKQKQDDAFRSCPDLAMPCADAARSNSLLESGRSRAQGANIAFGIAAVAAVGAGVLWFTGAPDPERTRRVSLAPSVAAGEAGVAVIGSF